MTSDITNIPLNKLTAWEGNVRKTQNKGSIDELAANIKAIGLQQNLIVTKDGKKFAVVAGRRRLTALQKLAKAGDIEDTYPVPCQIAADDADLAEISLAENTVRENMHPSDECEAFTQLAEKGMPIPDIAGRFGKTERYVQQRLRIARGVSPKIMKAYRAGDLTLEHVHAFAVTDDHAAQEAVFEDFDPKYDEADEIRDRLTQGDIPAIDRRVKYVTLAAYESAGGTVKRDLFGDEKDVYILDHALLNKLVEEKLARSAKPVEKEGWKWVEVLAALDHRARNRLNSIYAGKGGWTKTQLSYAGAIVTVGSDGKTSIERGLVRPEDMPKKKVKAAKPGSKADDGDADEPGQEEPSDLSAALIESLTTYRTEAVSAELAQRPDIALAAVVYTLASEIILPAGSSALQIRASEQYSGNEAGGEARLEIEKKQQAWGDTIPGEADALWEWCLQQDRDVLLDLLAFCAAKTVNAIKVKHDRLDTGRFTHADHLATTLNLDMKKWFTPTAANYFDKVGKPQIIEALQDVDATLPTGTMKKADMAKLAEQAVAGKGWLPKILRK